MSTAVTTVPATDTIAAAKLRCPFHVTLAAFLVTLTFFFCGRSVADPDIWWHLRNAQILLQQHHWIRFDQYSFTVTGTPWINSEWLSEVAYYGAWKVGGVKGIFLLYLFMAESVMLGVLYVAYRASESIKAAFLASTFGVLLAVVNFGPRTILFGWACMVIVMGVLWQFLNRGRAPLWLLPLVFLFWVNLHGSWLIGIITFGIVAACGFVQGTWGNIESTRWSKSQMRQLLWTGIATIAVLFINPYGYKYVFYPFDLAYRQKLNVAHVEEWASVDFHEVRGKVIYVLLMSLLLLALTARRRWKLTEVALLAFALYTSLTYVRFLFLADILIAPILARRLDFVPAYRREIDKSWLNAAFAAALLSIVLYRLPTSRVLQDDIAKKFPLGGIHYLQTHAGANDRTVNHYMYGGYMIWSNPAIPTFIDSRTDIFEYKGVLKDYLDMLQMKDSLNIIDRYHARFVLFSSKDPLTYLLKQSSKWHLAYEDEVSCVFERTTPVR